MAVFLLLFTACLHAQSAKQVGDREEAGLDDLLNLIWEETTTEPAAAGPEVTTLPQPYFEAGLSRLNNTVQLGAGVSLHCFVKDLSHLVKVSWLRRLGDRLTLLSVGEEKYSSDERYSVTFRPPHDWQLRLEGARQSDQGLYECQVSSHPPIVQTFYLTVIVPKLEIADERGLPIKHKFYNSGSTIELKCLISRLPAEQRLVLWRLGEKCLNFDNTRGGISVKTDFKGDGALSSLYVANASPYDSGNYTCSLGDIAHASVMLLVLNGESPAAMHIGGSCSLSPAAILCLLAIILVSYSR